MAHLEFEKPLAELERRIAELRKVSGPGGDIEVQVGRLEAQAARLQADIYRELTVWQKVQLSRHPERPYLLDYLGYLVEDFVELHGDRCFRDDPAIVAGFGRLRGKIVAIIGQQKGRTTKEKVHRNFGMAHPEGYRKAIRVLQLAERYRRPVVTFIDTPGAYPGVGAEERGQSEAIGQAILAMSQARLPSVAVVIGEGGSGGALALGVASRVLMMQYSIYSVISPEGCASILWHDAARAADAAGQLRLLATDAQRLGIVDDVVEEPLGGAHRDPEKAAQSLGDAVESALQGLDSLEAEALVDQRYAKFRAMGRFLHATQ